MARVSIAIFAAGGGHNGEAATARPGLQRRSRGLCDAIEDNVGLGGHSKSSKLAKTPG